VASTPISLCRLLLSSCWSFSSALFLPWFIPCLSVFLLLPSLSCQCLFCFRTFVCYLCSSLAPLSFFFTPSLHLSFPCIFCIFTIGFYLILFRYPYHHRCMSFLRSPLPTVLFSMCRSFVAAIVSTVPNANHPGCGASGVFGYSFSRRQVCDRLVSPASVRSSSPFAPVRPVPGVPSAGRWMICCTAGYSAAPGARAGGTGAPSLSARRWIGFHPHPARGPGATALSRRSAAW
jgi:hypothetical protein